MPDPVVERVVADYRARAFPPAAAVFARQVVAASAPAGVTRARTLLWTCARLGAFGISVGLELTPEVLLHPSVIERFVMVGLKDAPVGRQRDIRTNLRFVARRVAPRLQSPDKVPLARSRAKSPYSEADIDGYFLCARYQSTEARRQRLTGLLCLGLGAGLDGGDLRQVTGRHVRCRSGGVVVVIEGRRARVVPVLARYQPRLLAAAGFAGGGFITGGVSPDRKNVTSPLVGNVAGGIELPRLDIGRLRATWLCEQLARLGVPALLAAAGVSCSQRLGDIAAHLEAPAETALVELLGGRC